MKPAKTILAENLKRLMEESRDLPSQNAAGKRSGVGQTTIGNWLREEIEGPRLDQVELVARAYGITVAEMLTERTPQPRTASRTVAAENPAAPYASLDAIATGLAPEHRELLFKMAQTLTLIGNAAPAPAQQEGPPFAADKTFKTARPGIMGKTKARRDSMQNK